MRGEEFGAYVRRRRESLRESDRSYSLRQVAMRIGVEPSYLSKVERGEQPPPSEERIVALAAVLGEDPDVLLALAGKVSADLRQTILERPRLFAQLLRELRAAPDEQVEDIARRVREGEW